MAVQPKIDNMTQETEGEQGEALLRDELKILSDLDALYKRYKQTEHVAVWGGSFEREHGARMDLKPIVNKLFDTLIKLLELRATPSSTVAGAQKKTSEITEADVNAGDATRQKELLPCPLDCIRCEALAVAGFTKEATAVSAVRVAIDELSRAYEAFDIHDFERSARLDFAILKLIGKTHSVGARDSSDATGAQSLGEEEA